ncbi:hypothetical protein BGZ82_008858 [Podila clonocystis]|nr:hypothetical protein BGZ82_008858 [Podila clonocystis]
MSDAASTGPSHEYEFYLWMKAHRARRLPLHLTKYLGEPVVPGPVQITSVLEDDFRENVFERVLAWPNLRKITLGEYGSAKKGHGMLEA